MTWDRIELGRGIVRIFAEAQGQARVDARVFTRAAAEHTITRQVETSEPTVREHIEQLLLAPGGVDRTDQSIARETGHDAATIGETRRALGLPASEWMRRRHVAAAMLVEHPELGNGPIATATGAAPATVRILRAKLGIAPIVGWSRRSKMMRGA